MSHYKDGSEARIGDRCRFKAGQTDPATNKYGTVLREGVIYDIQPSVSMCNAQVAYAYLDQVNAQDGTNCRLLKMTTTFVTLGECEPPEKVAV